MIIKGKLSRTSDITFTQPTKAEIKLSAGKKKSKIFEIEFEHFIVKPLHFALKPLQ